MNSHNRISRPEIPGSTSYLKVLFHIFEAFRVYFRFHIRTTHDTSGSLPCTVQSARGQEKAGSREKGGFLGRAFQQAKRLGEAIDPDAVAQAEQAWKVRETYRLESP